MAAVQAPLTAEEFSSAVELLQRMIPAGDFRAYSLEVSPATNQHGETVWPVLMLMVAHEMQSGCALIPEFGAKYGPDNTSEARQAIAIARRIPPNSLILADAGFGIFRVAHAMAEAGHDILFRLTKARFNSMRRGAEMIDQTEHGARYRPTCPDV